jgi:hypothetical protein
MNWLVFPLAIAATAALANPMLFMLGGGSVAGGGSGSFFAATFDGAANCAGGTSIVSSGANAEGATDSVWTTDTGIVTWEGQWTMDYPASATVCSGDQTFTIRARKNTGGGSNGAIIEFYTDATDNLNCSSNLAGTHCSSTTITSEIGQDVVCTLTCNELPDTWPQIQVEIVGQTGGSGGAARAVQIDSIVWGANWSG